jgi:hypothetical protein
MATRFRMAARLLSPNLPELWRLGRWQMRVVVHVPDRDQSVQAAP